VQRIIAERAEGRIGGLPASGIRISELRVVDAAIVAYCGSFVDCIGLNPVFHVGPVLAQPLRVEPHGTPGYPVALKLIPLREINLGDTGFEPVTSTV
jgi:hypothetical protein